MKIVITGGHHTSVLPVIDKIQKEHPEDTLYWFGHKNSMKGNKNETLEYKEITSKGIPFYNLKAGKLYRTLNPIRLLKIPFGVIQSLYLLIKIKPDIILSFGGYLAAPVVLAGWLLKIPSITHEQTIVAGYANKFISKFVQKILISWPESAKYFPEDKIILTGLPLRDSIFIVKSNSFEVKNSLPYIYITAGKTGSHKINQLINKGLSEILKTYNVIHQTGDHSEFKDFESINDNYSKIKDSVEGKYFSRKFIFEDEIGEAFNKADIIICRSGAHTVSELLALNKKSILIPIPWVSHNEQFKNAEVLEKIGLGIILEEENLNLGNILDKLNYLKNKEIETSNVNKYVFNKKSEEIIVNEIYKTAEKK